MWGIHIDRGKQALVTCPPPHEIFMDQFHGSGNWFMDIFHGYLEFCAAGEKNFMDIFHWYWDFFRNSLPSSAAGEIFLKYLLIILGFLKGKNFMDQFHGLISWIFGDEILWRKRFHGLISWIFDFFDQIFHGGACFQGLVQSYPHQTYGRGGQGGGGGGTNVSKIAACGRH